MAKTLPPRPNDTYDLAPKRFDDELGESAYLDFVRNFPCLSCGTEQNVVAHHYMENDGGVALKVSDFNTVPLCSSTPERPGCHDIWHISGRLPCYRDVEPLQLAVTMSRALMYRAQARMLAHWMTVF